MFYESWVTGDRWARRGLGHPEEKWGTAFQSLLRVLPVLQLLVDQMAFELKFTFPAYAHGCGKGARSMNTCWMWFGEIFGSCVLGLVCFFFWVRHEKGNLGRCSWPDPLFTYTDVTKGSSTATSVFFWNNLNCILWSPIHLDLLIQKL